LTLGETRVLLENGGKGCCNLSNGEKWFPNGVGSDLWFWSLGVWNGCERGVWWRWHERISLFCTPSHQLNFVWARGVQSSISITDL